MKTSEIFRRFKSSLGTRKPELEKTGYQDSRYPNDQFDLISKSIDDHKVNSILEVGCNQGLLLRRFKSLGNFCVGLDIDTHWEKSDQNAALGVYPVDDDLIAKLPLFDCVFLLSVHHQWVRLFGDDHTKRLVSALTKRAGYVFFIEFSALAKKYGYENNQFFIDNDEDSVVEYAMNWLESAGLQNSKYLGKCREYPPREPYRFMFSIERDSR